MKTTRRLITAAAVATFAFSAVGLSTPAHAGGYVNHQPSIGYCSTVVGLDVKPMMGPTFGYERGQRIVYKFWIYNAATRVWTATNWFSRWSYTVQVNGDVTITQPGNIDGWFPQTHIFLPHGTYQVWTEAYWYAANGTIIGSDQWPSAYTQDRGYTGYTNSATCTV